MDLQIIKIQSNESPLDDRNNGEAITRHFPHLLVVLEHRRFPLEAVLAVAGVRHHRAEHTVRRPVVAPRDRLRRAPEIIDRVAVAILALRQRRRRLLVRRLRRRHPRDRRHRRRGVVRRRLDRRREERRRIVPADEDERRERPL